MSEKISEKISIFDVLKNSVSKTNLANIVAFTIILGMLYFGIETKDRDIIITLGSAGIGYLFGVNRSNGE